MLLRGGVTMLGGALLLAAPSVFGAPPGQPPPKTDKAQPPPKNDKAQAIFAEARKLDDAREFPKACALYDRALVLEPNAIGGRLHLARCLERIDKLGSAVKQYEIAEHSATAEGQTERASYAHKQLEALVPRLAMLTVEVSRAVRATADPLHVTRDGEALLEATWGRASPVDAGSHVLRAFAEGRAAWSRTVEMKNGQSLSVEVPVLARNHSSFWPWLSGGLGVAMGAAAGVFAYDQSVAQASVRRHCDATSCDGDDGFSATIANARLQRDFALAIGLGIGAGVALGTGIIGLATSSETSTSAHFSPWFGFRSAGIGMSMVFE